MSGQTMVQKWPSDRSSHSHSCYVRSVLTHEGKVRAAGSGGSLCFGGRVTELDVKPADSRALPAHSLAVWQY